ncbi:MAG: Dps family protein [Phototrophicales bacterium]
MTVQQTQGIKPDLGLSEDATNTVVTILQRLLADEHVLYMKLRNYHWNVTGPHFRALHQLFEEQYTQLATTIDLIAERIRSYGAFALGTMQNMIEQARLEESPHNTLPARDMVANIVTDHETMVRNLRQDIDQVDDIDDDGAEDFLTGLLQTHQEMAWMLRTYLEG